MDSNPWDVLNCLSSGYVHEDLLFTAGLLSMEELAVAFMLKKSWFRSRANCKGISLNLAA